jgi:DNA polymerase mu
LVELASVFTIGHHTALELYDTHGCRSIRDVVLHYASLEDGVTDAERARRRREGGMSKGDIVSEWVKISDELATPIPRAEVEEIGRCVFEQLEAVVPGCEYTLCGG